jgi:hypothetical protein
MTLPAAFLEARDKYLSGVTRSVLSHWRYRELHPESDREDFLLMREYFADILGNAVAKKDSAIFRTIADILDGLPDGDYGDGKFAALIADSDLNPVRFVIEARIKLEAAMVLRRSPRRELTKREVRHLARRLWAVERLVVGGKLKRSLGELSPEQEKLIEQEIDSLPDQDWTELFTKAGCGDLKNARAGRPPKKRKN